MRPLAQQAALRTFAALGVLAGFVYGLHHQAHVTCASRGPAATVIGRCTNRSVIAIGLDWGLALGGGVLIGGAVGLLFAAALRPR